MYNLRLDSTTKLDINFRDVVLEQGGEVYFDFSLDNLSRYTNAVIESQADSRSVIVSHTLATIAVEGITRCL